MESWGKTRKRKDLEILLCLGRKSLSGSWKKGWVCSQQHRLVWRISMWRALSWKLKVKVIWSSCRHSFPLKLHRSFWQMFLQWLFSLSRDLTFKIFFVSFTMKQFSRAPLAFMLKSVWDGTFISVLTGVFHIEIIFQGSVLAARGQWYSQDARRCGWKASVEVGERASKQAEVTVLL